VTVLKFFHLVLKKHGKIVLEKVWKPCLYCITDCLADQNLLITKMSFFCAENFAPMGNNI